MKNATTIITAIAIVSILGISLYPHLLLVFAQETREIWESLPMMPTPRTEVVAVAVDEKIFVIGGFDRNGKATDTVEVYDTVNNSWGKVSPMPEKLHHVGAAAASNNEIYVVGGYKNGWIATNSMFIYNTDTDTWDIGPTMPTARGALTVQVIDDTLYAVGGANKAVLSTNESFNIIANTWEAKTDMPTAREHLSSAVVEGKMYVIGGRVMSMTSNLGTNEAYNPQTDKWETLEDMPTARGGLTATAISDTVFVFGGEQQFGTFNQNEQYIPYQAEWKSQMDMPTARHGLGSATVNDRIYVIGGGVVPGLSVSGLNESYYNANYIPEFSDFASITILLVSSLAAFLGISKFKIGHKLVFQS
ncbi:MAG: Kelch repeat-containing protein [Nitrosopumilus sp.]